MGAPQKFHDLSSGDLQSSPLWQSFSEAQPRSPLLSGCGVKVRATGSGSRGSRSTVAPASPVEVVATAPPGASGAGGLHATATGRKKQQRPWLRILLTMLSPATTVCPLGRDHPPFRRFEHNWPWLCPVHGRVGGRLAHPYPGPDVMQRQRRLSHATNLSTRSHLRVASMVGVSDTLGAP